MLLLPTNHQSSYSSAAADSSLAINDTLGILTSYTPTLPHYLATKGWLPRSIVKWTWKSNGNVRYPSGGEDVTGALKWITKNLGKEREVFLKGNSSGAVRFMTLLFETSFIEV